MSRFMPGALRRIVATAAISEMSASVMPMANHF